MQPAEKFITSLLINGTECKDFRKFEREVFTFYSKLYSSEYSPADDDGFCNKIHNLILCIDILTKHLNICVIYLFHQFFWKDLRTLPLDALKDAIEKKELMPSMKQGLITLIPKSVKEKITLVNLRPITLLNSDYKMLSGAVAEMLKKGISNIVKQSVFFK